MEKLALLGIGLALVGLILSIVGLRPAQWKENLTAWWQLARRDVQIFARRIDWDRRHLSSIINDSTKLVIITSYEGPKDFLWTALRRRLEDPKPFELTFLRLKPGSHSLRACLDITKALDSVTDSDRDGLRQLEVINRTRRGGERKELHSGFWDGISPGLIVCWTIGSKTTVAFGPWLQVEGCRDTTPWIVARRGPLFEALRRHCETLKDKYQPDQRSKAEVVSQR